MDEAGWQSCSDLDAMIAVLNGKISVRKARLFEAACCRRIWDLISEQRCQLLMEEGKRNGGLQLIEDAGGTVRSCREAVELAERAADGNVSEADLVRASVAAASFGFPAEFYAACYDESWGLYNQVLMASGEAATAASTASQKILTLPWAANYAARAVARIKDQNPRFEFDGSQMDATERSAQCDVLREIVGNPFRRLVLSGAWRSENDSTVIKIARAIYEERAFERLPVLAAALETAGCTDAELLGHCREQRSHSLGCWAIDIILGKE